MLAIQRNIITGVSWSSAFAGAVLGLMVLLALSMIGLAVAGESVSPGSFSEVGWGSLLWMVICLAVTGYCCGLIAAKAAPGLTVKSAGMWSGAIAGALILIACTMFSFNVISGAARATFGMAGSAVQAGASGVSGIDLENAARRLGLEEELTAVTSGWDRQEIEQMIANASPQLTEQQVTAATSVVMNVLANARQEIVSSATNINRLGQVVRASWQNVQNQLTGSRFVDRLQGQGLSYQQAQDVAAVIGQRLDQLQQNVQQALNALEQQGEDITEAAGGAVATGAIAWLVMAGLLIGLGSLGGAQGTDEHRIEEELEEREHRLQERREELRH
ncbi:MAG: hypothetical protein KDD69_10765 [Bdellovibrionales bacterium]|nr:hypothetical protein [Bdellovibrionales bacterium]